MGRKTFTPQVLPGKGRGGPRPRQEWPAAGGEAGELIRTTDWEPTPLGSRDRWPGALRTVVGLVVQARTPMAIAWGPALALFANDAFWTALHRAVPELPGRSLFDVWAALAPVPAHRLDPVVSAVMERGETLSLEDERFRGLGGAGQGASYAVTFSPVRGEDGAVAGMLVVLAPTLAAAELSDRLREVEQRLSVVYQRAPFGIALSQVPGGALVDVNDAFLALFGYSREEVLGRTSIELGIAAEEQRAEVTRQFETRGAVRNLEVTRRTKTGEERVLSLNLDPVTIAGQQFVMTTIVDVTDRSRAEAALRRSEALFRTVVENSRDGNNLLDLKTGKYVFMSPAQVAMTGFTVEEMNSLSAEEAYARVHPDDRHISVERQRQVAAGHDPGGGVVEYRWRVKSGQYRWFGDSRRLVYDEKGQPVALVGNSRDITERKRAEEDQHVLAAVGSALSSLEPRAALRDLPRALLSPSVDFAGLFVIEEDQGELHSLSAAAVAPWAVEPLELLFRPPPRPGPEPKGPQHPVWVALRERRSMIVELTPERWEALAHGASHLRTLQEIQPTSALITPLLFGGECLGALVLVSTSEPFDAAALQLAEEVARRCAVFIENERLHAAERRSIQARDEVLGVVAHDLRNPLNTIVLQSRLLRRRGGQPERRAARPVEAIERAAQRMSRIVQDLLDITRLDAGRLVLSRACLSTSGLLSEVAETHRDQIAAKAIELRVDEAAGLPDVWGDRDRLVQVFENLLGNALKFTHGGCITIGAARSDGEVVFRVSDTGEGIPPEHVPHLFDRFWQARQSGRSGAGLGLDIVKGIVVAHGGHVWVDTRLGAGSTFFFSVPTADVVEEQVEAPEEAQVSAEYCPSVLVAEDDEEAREALVENLRDSGFRVVAVANGREALAALHLRPRPEVAIVDLSMPEMDGWEFLGARGRDPELRSVPVIVVTGERGVARQIAAANAIYLAKPVSVDELIRLVDDLRHEAKPDAHA